MVIARHCSATPNSSEASTPAPAVSAPATAPAASSPLANGRLGARSSVTSASGRVASSDTSGTRLTPAPVVSTAYRRSGTPSPGTRSTSAASAPATPATVPLSRTTPGASPLSAGPIRTGQAPGPAPGAGGIVANPTASAAVSRPDASPPSNSASPVPSSAAVAITALVRYGTHAAALPVSSATTAASR